MMTRLSDQKAVVREFLAARDRAALLAWAGESRAPFRTLTSMTFDPEKLIIWRAIEATGWVAAAAAESDLQSVKDLIRRQLWLMNDESGGLGWYSPELIGEILVNVPTLISEFAPLLPSYLIEEPFERGTHLAMWRISQVAPQAFEAHVHQLGQSLNDADAAIRAFAALTLLRIDAEASGEQIEPLRSDDSDVVVYNFGDGQFRTTTVGGLVADADCTA